MTEPTPATGDVATLETAPTRCVERGDQVRLSRSRPLERTPVVVSITCPSSAAALKVRGVDRLRVARRLRDATDFPGDLRRSLSLDECVTAAVCQNVTNRRFRLISMPIMTAFSDHGALRRCPRARYLSTDSH